MTPQETHQSYLLVLEGLLWRRGLTGAYHREGGTGSSSPGRPPLVYTLFKVTINPTIALDPRDGLPQAKQLTVREYNPTHQQISGLKFY